MQHALFDVIESTPCTSPAPVLVSAVSPITPSLDHATGPAANGAHRVSNCSVCGGSGACFTRSNRVRTVPCVACAGMGRTVHSGAGLRLSLSSIALYLRERGIEVPEHSLYR
jgi:hypothetical protein